MHARLRLAESPAEDLKHSSPIHVVLADPLGFMRRSLRSVLDSEQGTKVVAEAADLAATLEAIEQEQPDVLLIDLHMSGGPPSEMIHLLHERAPRLGIVALSTHKLPTLARHALDAGARAFVLKQFADRELVAAVRAAAQGDVFVSPEIAELVRTKDLSVASTRT
jgi:DNA-binding NarL/FixJ family response regulator